MLYICLHDGHVTITKESLEQQIQYQCSVKFELLCGFQVSMTKI